MDDREPYANWRHVFKLDPDKWISDADLEQIARSGTDAIIVGGSSGVTFDNTLHLLKRLSGYNLCCALEISDASAVVPGFDLYFVPIVLNARDPKWIVGEQQQALKQYGGLIDWKYIVSEGYIVMNEASTVAKRTEAQTVASQDDLEAYALVCQHLFHCPIVYIEYSGSFGNMDWVSSVCEQMNETRLFYGGGVDSPERARAAARAAHTVIVGNIIYEALPQALETVKAVKGVR